MAKYDPDQDKMCKRMVALGGKPFHGFDEDGDRIIAMAGEAVMVTRRAAVEFPDRLIHPTQFEANATAAQVAVELKRQVENDTDGLGEDGDSE